VKGARRLPFALTVAACGWIPVNTTDSGLLPFNAVLAFGAVVIAARLGAVPRHRPLTWAWPRVAVATAVALALALASLSYGALHPLVASSGGATPAGPGVFLYNDGSLSVRVLDVDVPGRQLELAAGTTIAPGHGDVVYLRGACRSADRVVVRMRVVGREVHMTLPVRLSC
jgi:hypothetical protein